MNAPVRTLAASLALATALLACPRGAVASHQPNRAPGRQLADADLPAYNKTRDVSGSIRAIGGSTVSGLLDAWAASFTSVQPRATLAATDDGSGAAAEALIAGSTDLAVISRPLTTEEVESFRSKHGHDPLRLSVAVDALAVFVHKSNPVESLTLEQLDSIFSASRRRGGEPLTTWGQLGLSGEWQSRPIRVYGFGGIGTGHSLFRDTVMRGGDFVASLNAEPGSSAIVNAVGTYREGIGFASQYFATARTRAVPLVGTDGRAYAPDAESCRTGVYPLARDIYIYVNRKPGSPLPPHVAEFLTFILSRQGQQAVLDTGMFPISPDIAQRQLAAIRP